MSKPSRGSSASAATPDDGAPAAGDDPAAGGAEPALPAGHDERTGRGQAMRTIGLVPSFDGIRGFWVVVVVAFHLKLLVAAWNGYLTGAYIGVDVFFVLSGFLITAILLREHDRSGRVRLWPFYQGRMFRLLPALFAMVAVEFVWSRITHISLSYELAAVASGLTYLSNWSIPLPWHVNGFLGPDVGMSQLWSLAIEEQFYLVWPLVLLGLLALGRRLRGASMLITALLIVVVMAHRIIDQANGAPWLVLYERTDYRADDLLWGALLAQIWVRGWIPRRGLVVGAWIGTAVAAGFLFFSAQRDSWVYVWGLPVMAIAAVVVVVALVETDWPLKRLLEARWICTLGVVSYGIYVWHLLAIAMVQHGLSHWAVGYQIAAAALLTAAMTVASWFLIERPFLRGKDRLRRRAGQSDRRSAVPAAPAGAPTPPAAPTPPVTAASGAGRPDPTESIDPAVAGLFDISPPAD